MGGGGDGGGEVEDFEGITWFQGKRRGNQSLLRKFKEWTGENWQTINFQLG